MPVFYQAVQNRRALKTIPLLSFLTIFDLNMQNVTKNDGIITELSLQLKNRSLHSSGSIQPGACMVYKHGQEAIRLHKLSQVFKNVYCSNGSSFWYKKKRPKRPLVCESLFWCLDVNIGEHYIRWKAENVLHIQVHHLWIPWHPPPHYQP